MNKELLKYIKELSLKDKKTLTQKALKACEEVGELAKAVLPFENAYATNHRFVEKKKILEESVDVILTAISIAYDLGYDDQEVEEMMLAKASDWQEKQNREDKVNYPIPYEIHVTIERPEDTDSFIEDCKAIEVKPIILDLQNGGDSVMLDVMTSSHYFGDNKGSYEDMKRISNHMSGCGYTVLREKIETVPFHPAAPSDEHNNPKMPKDCYFESHLAVIVTDITKVNLKEISDRNDAHLSRNFFKKIDNEKYIIMVTLRKYDGTYETFKDILELLKKDITDSGFELEKEIVEFSIFDTKVSHDFKWLDK